VVFSGSLGGFPKILGPTDMQGVFFAIVILCSFLMNYSMAAVWPGR